RIRQQERNALDREARTAALYSLSRDLASAPDEARAAKVLAEHAANVFRSGAAMVLSSPQALPVQAAGVGDLTDDLTHDGVVRWVLEHGRPAGLGTDTVPGAPILCMPLASNAEVLGVLALSPAERRTLHQDELELLQAFTRQGSVAIERARFAEDAKAAALRARTEEMRSSLLSAVSHDLRTPLAAITGAATTLRDADGVPLEQRSDLLQTICEEAERLERLLGNLLDMTRVEARALGVKREWVPLEELIGSALTRLEGKLGSRVVETDLPTDLPLLGADPVLLEQVFVNLIENACKYTPPQTPIEVKARVANATVTIEIADRGPGIPAGDEERVFDKFYRGPHVGIGGVGLGLPICRGIVDAHGGSIRAENRVGGGAVFRIDLPLVGEAPTISRMLDPNSAPGGRT
ncbi:MAG TPA: ATP-binding protein, partial [Polyangiales bacterium]